VEIQREQQEQRLDRDHENNNDIAHAPSMLSIQRRGTDALLEGVSRLPQRAPPQVQVTGQSVLDEFRAQPGIPANSPQRDVLSWFRSRQHIQSLQHVFQLAAMYIAVPSTTAPSERVGSTAGQVYSKRRIALAPSVAEYLVVLHESRRRVARKIVESSPPQIMAEIQAAFIHEHALSDNDEGHGNRSNDESSDSDDDDDD
jgi:hypothetical protein